MDAELTIVIPAVNADAQLLSLLNSLCRQDYTGLLDARVLLVAEELIDGAGEYCCPAGSALDDLVHRFEGRLTLETVRFGSPSRAARRNAGARLATTPYLLFLDPDVELSYRAGPGRELDRSLLRRALDAMTQRGLHLITTRVVCLHGGFLDDVLCVVNNLAQRASQSLRPFAACSSLGMFLLFDREQFLRLGGFNERVQFADGALLSKGVSRERFAVLDGRVLTPKRRLRLAGHAWMAWVLMQAILHRWNQQFVLPEPDPDGWLTPAQPSRPGFAQNELLGDDGV